MAEMTRTIKGSAGSKTSLSAWTALTNVAVSADATLIVGVVYNPNSSLVVKWNGQELSKDVSAVRTGQVEGSIWSLKNNPTSGTGDITVSWTANVVAKALTAVMLTGDGYTNWSLNRVATGTGIDDAPLTALTTATTGVAYLQGMMGVEAPRTEANSGTWLYQCNTAGQWSGTTGGTAATNQFAWEAYALSAATGQKRAGLELLPEDRNWVCLIAAYTADLATGDQAVTPPPVLVFAVSQAATVSQARTARPSPVLATATIPQPDVHSQVVAHPAPALVITQAHSVQLTAHALVTPVPRVVQASPATSRVAQSSQLHIPTTTVAASIPVPHVRQTVRLTAAPVRAHTQTHDITLRQYAVSRPAPGLVTGTVHAPRVLTVQHVAPPPVRVLAGLGTPRGTQSVRVTAPPVQVHAQGHAGQAHQDAQSLPAPALVTARLLVPQLRLGTILPAQSVTVLAGVPAPTVTQTTAPSVVTPTPAIAAAQPLTPTIRVQGTLAPSTMRVVASLAPARGAQIVQLRLPSTSVGARISIPRSQQTGRIAAEAAQVQTQSHEPRIHQAARSLPAPAIVSANIHAPRLQIVSTLTPQAAQCLAYLSVPTVTHTAAAQGASPAVARVAVVIHAAGVRLTGTMVPTPALVLAQVISAHVTPGERVLHPGPLTTQGVMSQPRITGSSAARPLTLAVRAQIQASRELPGPAVAQPIAGNVQVQVPVGQVTAGVSVHPSSLPIQCRMPTTLHVHQSASLQGLPVHIAVPLAAPHVAQHRQLSPPPLRLTARTGVARLSLAVAAHPLPAQGATRLGIPIARVILIPPPLVVVVGTGLPGLTALAPPRRFGPKHEPVALNVRPGLGIPVMLMLQPSTAPPLTLSLQPSTQAIRVTLTVREALSATTHAVETDLAPLAVGLV